MKRQLHLISVLIMFFLFAGIKQHVYAQKKFERVHIKESVVRDPKKLVNALIEGKTNDQDKFDAIFSWVAYNVHYEYKYYNKGLPAKGGVLVESTLKRRSGLCLDYARLMDTLCSYAGIQNVTVTGYTKEIYFDMKDTMYFDNHAWNAVNLDGLWYVYDVTWCSGNYTRDYTKLAKWRFRMIEKLYTKTKSKVLKLQTKSYKYDFCKKYAKPGASVTIEKLRKIPKFLIFLLSLPKFRIKMKYNHEINDEFYLTNPEYFAVTHYPNDSIWSLTPRTTSTSRFSADSAYYDIALLPKVDRNVNGRQCLECDTYYFSDEKTKDDILLRKSKSGNPNNHLVPSYYDYKRAAEYLDSTMNELDSLTKMGYVDSTLYFAKNGIKELNIAKSVNLKNTRFQKAKHSRKVKVLVKDNRSKSAGLNSLFAEIKKRKRLIFSIVHKSERICKQNWDRDRVLQSIYKEPKKPKKMSKEFEKKLLRNYTTNRASMDSLNLLIDQLEDTVETHYQLLFKNLILKQKMVNPILQTFNEDGFIRKMYLLDSDDKELVDLRIELNQYIDAFSSTVDKDILTLSDTLFEESLRLFKLMSERNRFQGKAGKDLVRLDTQGLVGGGELSSFRAINQENLESESCYGIDLQNALQEIKLRSTEFINLNQRCILAIKKNTACEKARKVEIYDLVMRENKRINLLVRYNTNSLKSIKNKAVTEKKKFQDIRRKEIQKERKSGD